MKVNTIFNYGWPSPSFLLLWCLMKLKRNPLFRTKYRAFVAGFALSTFGLGSMFLTYILFERHQTETQLNAIKGELEHFSNDLEAKAYEQLPYDVISEMSDKTPSIANEDVIDGQGFD